MSFLWRIRLIYGLVIILAILFVYRLFSLQIVSADYYLARADRQYQDATFNTAADRGSIFFSGKNGDLMPAATMQDGFLAAINPGRLEDPTAAYVQLTKIIMLDRETFFKKASKSNDSYEELVNRLDTNLAGAIYALNIPGVAVYRERWRFYPLSNLASHALGFLAYDETGMRLAGRYGLEKYYDDLLRRRPDQSFIDFLSKTLSEVSSSVISYSYGEREADFVLTIEPRVQSLVEEELRQVKETRRAEAAGAIILDPATGEILALAALPDFDPNARQTDISTLSNPLVESVFEMGSVMKPLTLAAALDAGAIKAETAYFDQGFVILNNREIKNFDGKGRGQVTMQEVLNQSLNTGAVFAMQQLGRNRFREYFLNYGLGEKTDVDLPGEIAGLVKNLSSRQDVDYATAAFGQGIAATPLGFTRALATLANGGILIKPHIVKRFEWRNSRLITEVKPEVQRRVLRPETSAEITRMLTEVVDTALIGGKAKLPHYQIAAKTGTAQMPLAGGGYDPSRFLHSFFGYFPSSSPRFLIFLYLVNPQGARFASETLTQPFMNLAKFLLNYYDIPPDRPAPENVQESV